MGGRAEPAGPLGARRGCRDLGVASEAEGISRWEQGGQLGASVLSLVMAEQWEVQSAELGVCSGAGLAGVVFSVNNPIKNFKVLSLYLKDFSDGKPIFLVKELYTKEVFRPDRQLLVKFSFIGSIPNNGISYTDGNGKTRYYSISESGMDGSLVFVEF